MKQVSVEFAIRVALAREVQAVILARRGIQANYDVDLFMTPQRAKLVIERFCDELVRGGELGEGVTKLADDFVDLSSTICLLGQQFRLSHDEIDEVHQSILGRPVWR